MPAPLLADNSVPVLETLRLKLRRHRIDDLGACAAMWADPDVVRHIGGRPFTEEETWWKLLRYAGLWALLGYGYWVIEDKATGGFLGELGFADFHRDITPSIDGLAELGWVLASHAHGRGYATEAARAVLAWGDAHLDGAQTVCIIAPENSASVRVAEKCGYRLLARTAYKGGPALLFRR
jgi:RimJ/RimL family protein N-acetyltransferase